MSVIISHTVKSTFGQRLFLSEKTFFDVLYTGKIVNFYFCSTNLYSELCGLERIRDRLPSKQGLKLQFHTIFTVITV
jgi:hypothetical protein